MRKEKEEIMTDVVIDIKDLIETKEIKKEKKSNPKIDIIRKFLAVKKIARNSKEKIAEYTERNKKIRNGQAIIKGTRITTKELMMIMTEEKEEDVIEYILKQYPSIDCKEKIIYGALYEMNKENTLKFMLGVWLGK